MSAIHSVDFDVSSKNPLDLAEQLIIDRDWLCDRPVDEELVAEVQGSWCNFRIWFAWQPDVDADGRRAHQSGGAWPGPRHTDEGCAARHQIDAGLSRCHHHSYGGNEPRASECAIYALAR